MQRLKALDLTNEQLATSVHLMKLPKDFSNAIRNGLRIAQKDKGNEDFKFTPQEFREVMNDTVMSWKTTRPHLVESTMVLQSTIPPTTGGQLPSQPTPQGKPISTKEKSSWRGGRKPYKPLRSIRCQLCESEEHRMPTYKTYLGSAERRKRLVSLKKCPDCT